MTENLNILQKYLGAGEKKKGDNYAFICPFCRHHKKKLEVNIASGVWNCWVCPAKGTTLKVLLNKLNVKESYSFHYSVAKKTTTSSHVFLPQEYKPLLFEDTIETRAALIYLKNRGLTREDILKYKIGYCSSGPYSNCIVVPSYDRTGSLNYFVAKNFRTGKYINTSASKNIIFFDMFINWNEEVVLVEGVFDVFAVQRNCVPILGKYMSKKLKVAIVESKAKNYYVCLDGGKQELEDAQDIIKYITSIGKNVFHVKLPPEKDPSKIGKQNIWEHIYQAEKIEYNKLNNIKW